MLQEAAKQLIAKLEALDSDFKTAHLSIVDLIDDEDSLATEQDTLDCHDDEIAQLGLHVRQTIAACSTHTLDTGPRKVPQKRLSRLQRALALITTRLTSMPEGSDGVVLLRQFEEQHSDFKVELSEIRNTLYTLDLEDADALNQLQIEVEQAVFERTLDVKKCLLSQARTTSSSDAKGVKLPKIDVPTFDGNLLHWSTFWEQFDVSVHSKSSISDAEKLVYLQHSLKGGSAKQAIEGLSKSGEHYVEAVQCLKDRYNRPRLIHQAHVRSIVDTPSLKEGAGKELRQLHDVVQQHLRALKSLGHDPPGPFITSLLELKLDATTMFEWQRHSQDSLDVPLYNDLLKFINLRAQAAESSSAEPAKKSATPNTKGHSVGKSVAAFAASTGLPINCVACKREKHPLYACTVFKALGHEDRVSLLKSNGLCLNCMRPGHYIRDCTSASRCKRCQKPHHTLLHIETKRGPPSPETPSTVSVSNHSSVGLCSNVLLMTCRVLVEAPDGSTTESRALFDSGSSASFVSERLAQRLRLTRSNQSTRISGIAGLTSNPSTRSITSFRISSTHSRSKKFDVTAMIVSQVTCDLPLHSMPSSAGWEHLSGIRLADPEFGTPGRIDLLLGVETFVDVMGQGRRMGTPGTLIAFETQLGWVLAGGACPQVPPHHVAVHHVSLLTGDDLIRQFWRNLRSDP